jgi:hypothetical protein
MLNFNISVEGELPRPTGINSVHDKLPSCFPPPIMPFEHQVHTKTPLLMMFMCVTSRKGGYVPSKIHGRRQ